MLKISKIEDLKDKNERKGKKVTFRQLTEKEGGKYLATNLSQSRNFWEEHKHPVTGDVFKADSIYDQIIEGSLSIGSEIDGNINLYNTSEYQVGDNKVTSYKTVVLYGEDGVKYANSQLAKSLAVVVVDGVLSAPLPKSTSFIPEESKQD